MASNQLPLPFDRHGEADPDGTYSEKLICLLSQDLDFHSQKADYASHGFHSFPAKFPPQIPRKFITGLTEPGEVVLDPMAGSGTTVLEGFILGRRALGFDIDPLALLVSQVKTAPLDKTEVNQVGNNILKQATIALDERESELRELLENRWDTKTREFVDYWFALETQVGLLALLMEIDKIADESIRAFFQLVFSSIIITKSGGVSLAFDLAHTRPHRAKIVFSRSGEVLLGEELTDRSSPRLKFLTKRLRFAPYEFKKRFQQNLRSLLDSGFTSPSPRILRGNAENLPLADDSVDLIVTSPPYASNAIDYMRAHKFSLVWLGYCIDQLAQKRKEYIGGEATTGFDFERLPDYSAGTVAAISELDEKKGRVLHRYYSEMTRTLREMFRVLRPGKAAILVVGSSVLRGRDTYTQNCLAEIGQAIGFQVPKIGERRLDRNRRMLPAGFERNSESQIQQRMHVEYIIGFHKPES
ncbi:MAG: hypothetical protein CEE40_06575 [Chloroflexi bacterium B3_Chlor]|nr:MAG: hypothetical protein CEE40_06575 [Chloroflexi bacterium B3_Chlor]